MPPITAVPPSRTTSRVRASLVAIGALVAASVTVPTPSPEFWLVVRASGTGDGIYRNYLFYTDGAAGSGHTEVAKNINGSQTTIRSFATTFAAGDIIKISAVGTTITCYKNGVALGSITDSSLPSGSARLSAGIVEHDSAKRACTLQYGGPERAHVTGTLEGEPVDVTIDRADGCGISAYDKLFAALGRRPPLAG